MDEIIVNGYVYPSVEPMVLNSWLSDLSLIATFSYGMTPEGNLIPLDDQALIEAADQAGVGAMMVMTPMDQQGKFSEQLVSTVLENPEAVNRLLQEILNEMKTKNLFGVDFDFEYVPVQNRDQYTALVSKATQMYNPEGFLVTVALAPKTSADQPGLLYQGHDYAGMGQAANFVLLMTYEWGYTYGPPMAVAPINKVREVIEYGVSEIPPEKILMGIPNYGYDWRLPFVAQVSVAEKITNKEAVRRAQAHGVEIQFDQIAQSPHYNYWQERAIPMEDGTEEMAYDQHEVWFEDSRSYRAKMDLVKEYGLAGISIWNIMSYDPNLVNEINRNFSVLKVF